MAKPLGPYDETIYNFPSRYRRVVGTRQAPPYRKSTACYIENAFSADDDECRTWNWGPNNLEEFFGAPGFVTAAYNKAYERFVNQLGDSSSFGATLTAERKETLGMVTATVLKLASAARHVRRLNFGEAARILGVPYRERTIVKKRVRGKGRGRKTVTHRQQVMYLPTGRQVSKTLANGWLMYSYGVKPLAQDIYNGMDVLQRPAPGQKIRSGSSTNKDVLVQDRRPGYYPNDRRWKVKVRINCGATVSVENPNLWLCNKMGLINPVQWVNEAIPFSFVIDWFSNLSSVIGSMTDFVGLSVTDRWTSTKTEMFESLWVGGPYGFGPRTKERHILQRTLSLPTPRLQFAYERFSWQRGLNAISLLIGFLPKK